MRKLNRKDTKNIVSFGLNKLNKLKDNATDITKSTIEFVDDTAQSIFSKKGSVSTSKRL